MLRHTFVTTMLDAGVDLRDVQIAARHADPRTTMRYDRARTNLDRHPNYILAATWPPAPESAPRLLRPGVAGDTRLARHPTLQRAGASSWVRTTSGDSSPAIWTSRCTTLNMPRRSIY
jgi:Phage integrase family